MDPNKKQDLKNKLSLILGSQNGKDIMKGFGGPPNNNNVVNVPVNYNGRITKARLLTEYGTTFNNLWLQSNPHAMNVPHSSKLMPMATIQSTKQEHGCWIIHNTTTDTLRLVPMNPGVRDGMLVGLPGMGGTEVVACFFHTHPNTGEEGYDKGPSPEDINFVNNGFPGLVRSQIDGYHWYGANIPDQ